MRNHELINNIRLIFKVLKVSDIRITHRLNCWIGIHILPMNIVFYLNYFRKCSCQFCSHRTFIQFYSYFFSACLVSKITCYRRITSVFFLIFYTKSNLVRTAFMLCYILVQIRSSEFPSFRCFSVCDLRLWTHLSVRRSLTWHKVSSYRARVEHKLFLNFTACNSIHSVQQSL